MMYTLAYNPICPCYGRYTRDHRLLWMAPTPNVILYGFNADTLQRDAVIGIPGIGNFHLAPVFYSAEWLLLAEHVQRCHHALYKHTVFIGLD